MKEKEIAHHPCDEYDRSPEGDNEYPIGRSILRRLRKTLNEEWDYWLPEEGEDVVKTLYLTERKVCISEHLLGDEIVEDIISLFYYPLSAVREELKERARTKEFISIFVQPSYTDTSFTVMVTGEKVLLTVSDKAWNSYRDSEEEMVKELESWYQTAQARLKGGLRLFADDAWALRTLLRQVREEDIPRLERCSDPQKLDRYDSSSRISPKKGDTRCQSEEHSQPSSGPRWYLKNSLASRTRPRSAGSTD